MNQLPNAERFMAAVVEFSDDAIITKSLEGIITSWNKSAERLFGYTAQEAIGKPVAMLVPPDRADEELHILARLRRGDRIDHYETIRRRKDGSLIEISLTVSPVKDEHGRIIGASKIARDITEVRKARETLARSREQLEEAVKERTLSLRQAIAQLEEFSYSVSHDLKAPVRAMKGYAQALLEDYAGLLDSRGRGFLDRIITGGERMERLIHDTLTYSRIARSQVTPEQVSLQKLIPEIIQQYAEMQPPNARISVVGSLQPVLAHEPSLAQAISNLLANGVKFVARGTRPQLQVWTEPRNGRIRLWIKDNGIGIPPRLHPRLFGMFERLHHNPDYDGTGIGLAIVRKAAEKMNGTVGVESDGTSGSSFWIELPAVR